MQLLNATAQRLSQAAQTSGFDLVPGYYGGQSYCAGVWVTTHAEAFALGSRLGADFGTVDVDYHPKKTGAWLVFRDARVSA